MPRCDGTGPVWWHGRFRGCGYRVTAGRGAVLDVLTRSGKHLSADEIYMKVRSVCPGAGLTSVYRTLEILADMGLALKSDFGDGKARYELAEGSEKTHHHHLVCTSCKRVIDYTDFIDDEIEFLKRAEKGLSKKHDFEIKSHLIQFYGLCDKCRKK